MATVYSPPVNTYVPIADFTLGSNDTEIVFSNIPQGYRDLVLVGDALHSSTTQALRVRMAVTNHTYVRIYANASGRGAGSESLSGILLTDFNTTSRGTFVANIMDYSQTDKNKTVLVMSGNIEYVAYVIVGRYPSNNAVTSFTLFVPDNSAIKSGSRFQLYGVHG